LEYRAVKHRSKETLILGLESLGICAISKPFISARQLDIGGAYSAAPDPKGRVTENTV
jgi:hypothetical protein